jgi:hypothetical protein
MPKSKFAGSTDIFAAGGVFGVLSEPPPQPIKATKRNESQNSFAGIIFFPVIMGYISPVS